MDLLFSISDACGDDDTSNSMKRVIYHLQSKRDHMVTECVNHNISRPEPSCIHPLSPTQFVILHLARFINRSWRNKYPSQFSNRNSFKSPKGRIFLLKFHQLCLLGDGNFFSVFYGL